MVRGSSHTHDCPLWFFLLEPLRELEPRAQGTQPGVLHRTRKDPGLPASPNARPPLIPVPGEFLSRRAEAEAGANTLCHRTGHPWPACLEGPRQEQVGCPPTPGADSASPPRQHLQAQHRPPSCRAWALPSPAWKARLGWGTDMVRTQLHVHFRSTMHYFPE